MTGSRDGDRSAGAAAGSAANGSGDAREYLTELSAAQIELRQKLPPLRAGLKEAQRIVNRLRLDVHELDIRANLGAAPVSADADTQSLVEFDSLELQRFGDVDQTVLGLSEGLIELAGLHKGILAGLRRIESAATAQARAQAQIETRLLTNGARSGSDDLVGAHRVLVVKTSGYPIALPLECVAGVHRDPANTDDAARVVFNGQEYERGTLGELLGVAALNVPGEPSAAPVLVLIDLDNRRLAAVVDSVIREQLVKILPVGWPVNRLGWVAGAALLGNGQTAFVPRLTPNRPSVSRADAASRKPGAKDDEQPAVPDVVESTPATAPAPDTAAGAGAAAPPDVEAEPAARIMVVDDSATVRKFTERLLMRHGMHVETAKDGVDAMEKLEAAAPQVILLDIEMPRMNGFQFAAMMRQKPDFKDTPIIMISSRIAPKHQQVAGSLGVRKFLGKPYQEDELLAEIKALLD